jgi:hypothetical protein
MNTTYDNGVVSDFIGELVFTRLPDDSVALNADKFGINVSEEERQELMDALWSIGTRPTEGTGSAGAMAATVKHLEDMRKLVFDMFEKGGN